MEEGDKYLLRGNENSSILLTVAEGHGFDDAVLYYIHPIERLWSGSWASIDRHGHRPYDKVIQYGMAMAGRRR